MSKLEIAIFNVGAGQSILVCPSGQIDHTMLVDCGGEEDGFSPVDFLVKRDLLPKDSNNIPILGNLAITNYDHDHFSWLPDLWKKFGIWTVRFPKNITSQELKNHKEEETEALKHVCHIKDKYTATTNVFNPVYTVYSDHLEQSDLDGDLNTNHLGQIIFIEYANSKICITGDLERVAWEKILARENVKNHLKSVNVLVAPHHGRENGYHEDIFNHCSPEVIIISDKDIMHDTQGGMAQKYSNHVVGGGVSFIGSSRKILTTRSDGHILVNFEENGGRSYTPLNIN